MIKTGKSQRKFIIEVIVSAAAVILLLFIAGMFLLKAIPGYGFFIVKSGSMEPSISPGDIVITGPVGDKLSGSAAVDRIITFELNDAIVTHRVIGEENGVLKTKGDANEEADAHRVTPAMVKGVYLFKVPYLGYVTDFTGSRKGWFFAVIIPVVILVAWIVKDILKESFKPETKSPNRKAGENPKIDG